MSFSLKIVVTGNKSAKKTAKLINERRRQSQAWLGRQSEQKKQTEVIKK
jgi:hypothetical protein